MVAVISMKAREKIPGHFIFLNTPFVILKVHEFLNDYLCLVNDSKTIIWFKLLLGEQH